MKRWIISLAILVWCCVGAQAAGLFPLSRQQQFDTNNKALSGAKLYLFDGGTSTPRTGYKDLALTSPHPNPIVADSAGRFPLIYLDDGYYRQRLTSRTGTLIFDDDGIPVLTTSAGGAGTTVDPDSVYKTRDIKIRFDDQPLAGYVRLNGRTIGSAASGATERANADTQSLYEELWGFANISVTGGKGASAAADFAANKPLVLPNMAGRMIAGMDDLGAGAQSVLTSTYCTGPTLPGAVCGAQSQTLAASNLPVTSPWVPGAVSVSISGTGVTDSQGTHAHNVPQVATSGVSNTHAHTTAVVQFNIQVGGGNGVTVYGPTGTNGTSITPVNLSSSADSPDHAHLTSATLTDSQGSHAHNVSVTGSGTGSVSLGSNVGGGQAFSKLPPLMTMMIFIRL